MNSQRISFEEYQQYIVLFSQVPFSQLPAWISARQLLGKQYHFFVDDRNNPSFMFAAEVYNKPLLGEFIIVEGGPLITGDIVFQTLTKFVEQVATLYSYVEFNSALCYQAAFEVEMRRAGFYRPWRMINCPMTIEVDIHNNKPSRNWSREVKKAAKSSLKTTRLVEKPTANDVQMFIALFTEMSDAKNMGYVPTTNEIMALLQHDTMTLYVVEDDLGWVAARIIGLWQTSAHDVYAANATRSRRCSASHKLLLDIFEDLKNKDIEFFDFGRIGPSQSAVDSVFSFKRGAGGQVIAYNGGWVKCHSLIKELMLLTYRIVVQKKQRW